MSTPLKGLIIVATAWCIGAQTVSSNEKDIDTMVDGFRIVLPKGVVLKKKTPVEDFAIYELMRGSRNIAVIYAGDHPGFPRKNNNVLASTATTTMDCGSFRCLSFWDGGKLIGRELLVRVQGTNPPVRFLHAWTAKVHGADLIAAEKTLFSLTLTASPSK